MAPEKGYAERALSDQYFFIRRKIEIQAVRRDRTLTASQMATMRDRPMEVESAADEINMERRRYPRNGQSFHDFTAMSFSGWRDL